MPHRANRLLSKFHLLVTSLLPFLIVSFCVSSCSRPAHHDSSSLTFLIEASPTNLDPRFATDSQSQRIDGLLISGLLERENQMYFHGDLAESWSTPDALTYVFHLRRGVRFHDGRAYFGRRQSNFRFHHESRQQVPETRSPSPGHLRRSA